MTKRKTTSKTKPDLSELTEETLLYGMRDFYVFAQMMGLTWSPDPEKNIRFGEPHREACDFLAYYPSKKKTVLFPRGFRKSTLTQILTLWLILRNPNVTIMKVAHTKDFARSFIGEMEAKIESIPFLKGLVGHPWADDKFNVSRRSMFRKEPTVMCASPDSASTGFHPDFVIGDDLIADESGRSLTAMRKATEFVKKVGPLVGKTGTQIWVGTRYHRQDPYGWMIESGKYDVLRMGALDENEKSNWEEGAPTTHLMEERESMGELMFALQYECNTAPEGARVFKNPTFMTEQDIKETRHLPKKIYIDWAWGVGQCLTAAVVWCSTPDKRVFIIDSLCTNDVLPNEAAMNINIMAVRHNVQPTHIYCEPLPMAVSQAPEYTDKWDRLWTRGIPKESRIIRMADDWNAGKIFLHPTKCKDIVDSALDYPDCEFLDPLDVLAYCVRDTNE